MPLKVTKVEMWSVPIDDRAGGAGEKIGPLSDAGANFEFVFGRRTPEQPGKGILMVAPLKGTKVGRAASAAGFQKSAEIHGLRFEGSNKAGTSAKIMRALASAGISFRGFTASALGTKFVGYLAVDSAEDAARAAAVLKKVG